MDTTCPRQRKIATLLCGAAGMDPAHASTARGVVAIVCDLVAGQDDARQRLGAEQTHNFCLCTDRRVTTSTAATSGSASSPREESALTGFEVNADSPFGRPAALAHRCCSSGLRRRVGGRGGRVIVPLSKEGAMLSSQPLLDAAGRRRSPAATPGARAGIATRKRVRPTLRTRRRSMRSSRSCARPGTIATGIASTP